MTDESRRETIREVGDRLVGQGGEALFSRDGLMGLLLDQVPVVLWTTDLDLRFTLSCGAGLRALNLEENRVVGMSVFEYLGTDDPESEAVIAHRAALDGCTTAFEIDIRNGSWSCHAGPLVDPSGRRIGVVGIGLDITQRRLAEAALRKSEAKYRQLFEDSQDVIFLSTPEGRFIDVNPAGVKLFGFDSKEQMQTANVGDLYWSPVERSRYLQAIDGDGAVADMELHLKSRSGRKITVLETTQVVRSEQGDVRFYSGHLRDVTDRRKLEEQLSQSMRMEAIGRLAGAVAHDFNNVLTVIRGRTDLLMAQLDSAQPLAADVDAIREAVDRASTMTRQLLALRRHQEQLPSRVDLDSFLHGIEPRLRRLLEPRVELQLDLALTHWALRGDASQLEQALTQLAVNALEAMPEGGRLVIETRNIGAANREDRRRVDLDGGDYVLISVRDTGTGMTEEVRGHIFEPFFSTRRAGASAGLGLSTVYSVVTQHQGRIRVESEPGAGSTFYLYLPRYRESPAGDRDSG